MDAAAAACLACAVLEPQAVDLGGYVLAAVVLEAETGRVWSVDANTVAPAAATADMFRTLPLLPGRPASTNGSGAVRVVERRQRLRTARGLRAGIPRRRRRDLGALGTVEVGRDCRAGSDSGRRRTALVSGAAGHRVQARGHRPLSLHVRAVVAWRSRGSVAEARSRRARSTAWRRPAGAISIAARSAAPLRISSSRKVAF